MWSRWLVTVRIEMYRRPAISRLVSPSVNSPATSNSRAVSGPSGPRGTPAPRRAASRATARATSHAAPESRAVVEGGRQAAPPHRSRSISAASIVRSAASSVRPRPSRISAARASSSACSARRGAVVGHAADTPMPTAASGRPRWYRVRRSPPPARAHRRPARAPAWQHRRTRNRPPVPVSGRRRPVRSPPPRLGLGRRPDRQQ